MSHGIIQSLNQEQGFGFVRAADGGQDVFFHRSACPQLFTQLRRGQSVCFESDAQSERPRAARLWADGSADAGAGAPPTRGGRMGGRREPSGGRRADNRRPPLRGERPERSPRRPGMQRGGERPEGARYDRGSRDEGRRGARPTRAGGPAGPRSRPVRKRDLRPAVCENGFVTKLSLLSALSPAHGFISADTGGREIRFEVSAVRGDKRITQFVVGEYVEFAVREETREYTGPESCPIAYYVCAIEREVKTPRTYLPRHPRARRKKPTWR